MSIWRGLEQQMDAVVDAVFGETVEFHPWTTSIESDPTDTGGGPDATRSVITVTGIKAMPGAAVTGEGAIMGGQFNTQVVTQELWCSVTESQIGPLTGWKAYDRVFFVERNEWYAISYVEPSATGRPNVHLTRLQVND